MKINWFLDIVLFMALISIVLYAQIDGRYINNEVTIVEVCDGRIVDVFDKENNSISSFTYKGDTYTKKESVFE